MGTLLKKETSVKEETQRVTRVRTTCPEQLKREVETTRDPRSRHCMPESLRINMYYSPDKAHGPSTLYPSVECRPPETRRIPHDRHTRGHSRRGAGSRERRAPCYLNPSFPWESQSRRDNKCLEWANARPLGRATGPRPPLSSIPPPRDQAPVLFSLFFSTGVVSAYGGPALCRHRHCVLFKGPPSER